MQNYKIKELLIRREKKMKNDYTPNYKREKLFTFTFSSIGGGFMNREKGYLSFEVWIKKKIQGF